MSACPPLAQTGRAVDCRSTCPPFKSGRADCFSASQRRAGSTSNRPDLSREVAADERSESDRLHQFKSGRADFHLLLRLFAPDGPSLPCKIWAKSLRPSLRSVLGPLTRRRLVHGTVISFLRPRTTTTCAPTASTEGCSRRWDAFSSACLTERMPSDDRTEIGRAHV